MPCIYYLICWLGNWLPCSPVVSQTPWQYPAGPLRLHIGMLMGIEWDGSTSCCLSQVPRKPRCSCERCSGETGVLWLFALLLSILEALYFGSSSIFPLPTRCLREQAEESSGFFKMWKQHGKLLLCMSLHGIVNLIHSSLYMEKQGVHSSLMKAFQLWHHGHYILFPLVLPSAFGKSSAPGICICFPYGKRSMLILLWPLHMASLSALGYMQSGEWGGLSFPTSVGSSGREEGQPVSDQCL